MKAKTRQFIGAFMVSVIIIAAMGGFWVVDLSTQKYLPGKTGTIFAIDSIQSDKLDFAFMGKMYTIDALPAGQIVTILQRFRGLVARQFRVASAVAGVASDWFNAYQKEKVE